MLSLLTVCNAGGNVQAGGFYNNGDHHRLSTVQAAHIDHLALDSPPAHLSSGDEFGSFAADPHSNSSSQPSSACLPKSPVRAFVRAHLGDLGHTKITTMPGITVRDALSKAMKLRKLRPESCSVYNASDPSKVRKFLASGQTCSSMLINSSIFDLLKIDLKYN